MTRTYIPGKNIPGIRVRVLKYHYVHYDYHRRKTPEKYLVREYHETYIIESIRHIIGSRVKMSIFLRG